MFCLKYFLGKWSSVSFIWNQHTHNCWLRVQDGFSRTTFLQGHSFQGYTFGRQKYCPNLICRGCKELVNLKSGSWWTPRTHLPNSSCHSFWCLCLLTWCHPWLCVVVDPVGMLHGTRTRFGKYLNIYPEKFTDKELGIPQDDETNSQKIAIF